MSGLGDDETANIARHTSRCAFEAEDLQLRGSIPRECEGEDVIARSTSLAFGLTRVDWAAKRGDEIRLAVSEVVFEFGSQPSCEAAAPAVNISEYLSMEAAR